MEIKVAKIQLSITSNGTPKCYLWNEGEDVNSLSSSIEIIGEECIYLATRKIGETLEITQKGKWYNVVVPPEFQKALQSPAFDRVKLLFRRSINAIDIATNGARTSVDLDTAKVMLTNDLEVYLKLQDETLKTIKNTKTEYAKDIIKNLKLAQNEQTLNPYNELARLTNQSINNISKDYRIVNDGEELKQNLK